MPSALHYDAAGVPVRFLRDAWQRGIYPNPPAGGGAFPIPEDTNAALARDVAAWVGMPGCPYSVVSGQLRKGGVAVTVAPDPDGQDRADFDAQLAAYVGQLDAYLALAGPSSVQVTAQVRLLTQGVRRLCKVAARLRAKAQED